MILVRSLGTIRPGATATISSLPRQAQTSTMQNKAMIVPPMAPAIGGGGVSTISSAAGRKASSSWVRATVLSGRAARALMDFMDACLQTVQRRIAAACSDQIIMGAVLSQTAAVDSDQAIASPNGRQPMCDDEHGTAPGELRHVLLDDPLALVVESTRRLVEDQDARVIDDRAGDGQTLALSARQARSALTNYGVVTIGKLKDELMGTGHLRDLDDLFDRRRAVGERDVVADRAIEQDALL